jgi:N-formylmaleamate deformylase
MAAGGGLKPPAAIKDIGAKVDSMGEMEPWASDDVSTNGIKIHYYRTGGDRAPLVLLHGITDSGLCWPRVVQHLARHYDMVMVDARGHGLSDAPDTGYSFQDHATDVIGLIQTLRLTQPVLIGHSMGAMTATVVAASMPDHVRAIILEDPPFQASHAELSSEEKAALMVEWQTRIIENKRKTRSALIAARRAESPSWAEDELAPWAEAKLQVDPKVAELALAPRLPWQALIRRVICPILLITGDPEADAVVTPEIANEAAELWPRGEVAYIDHAGHNIRRDQFNRYMASVTAFLAAI